MSPRAPYFTLVTLLALAAIIFIGGSRLARREVSVWIERDRTALLSFSTRLQQELQRLEALYENHLRRLARDSARKEPFEIKDDSQWLVGVRQFSSVFIDELQRGGNRHVILDGTPDARLAEPCFVFRKQAGLDRPRAVISLEETLQSPENYGWIQKPGLPLYYWVRRSSGEALFLLVNPDAVAAAADVWIRNWAAREFAPVAAGGGPDQLLGYNGEVLAAAGEVSAIKGRANFLQPATARWGTWHVASWDRVDKRIRHNSAVLMASATIAVMIALLAFVVFIQQRNALRLAAQRVSFVNSVSHELRTPLTNIQLNLDLAADSITDTAAIRRLDLVREESGRLGRLIANVLTFSQRDKGVTQAKPSASRPQEILNAVINQFGASFARRGITLKQSGECHELCMVDGDAFAQIVANLLSNVEKYAPGSDVRIETEQAADSLAIRVADNGPGIPSHEAERIFQPFERLGSRVTEGVTGTGLGLAIARELALRMGGSLRLLPSEAGATFELRLPAPVLPPTLTIQA